MIRQTDTVPRAGTERNIGVRMPPSHVLVHESVWIEFERVLPDVFAVVKHQGADDDGTSPRDTDTV